VQQEGRGIRVTEGCRDGVEVFRTLGQDRHLAAPHEGVAHRRADGLDPNLIVGGMSEASWMPAFRRQFL
jgi:hypothetical protein